MMAAGQQKKRLASSNLHEKCRWKKKKKKRDSSDYMLNFKSRVHLEWDERLKKALAKSEQIGVAWRDMAPFIDGAPRFHLAVADVFSVPREIFNLDNLTELLSYEVWATCLSESEKELLKQLLPSGMGAEQVVHSLLAGENHHFGNPFLKWSSSLCSGDLHPDNVLRVERQCRDDKVSYYRELNKYHHDMIEILKGWKEIWDSSEDPEKLHRKWLGKHTQEGLLVSAEGMRNALNINKIPHEVCFTEDNASKYMSYIKISKKQLQLVKNLKQNGEGIPPKSLHRVLGDIKDFVVEPYEVYEEGEKKKLHDLWSRLANEDVSEAFDEWEDRKLQREKWGRDLKHELSESNKLMEVEVEKTKLETSLESQVDNEESKHLPTMDMLDQEDVSSPSNSPQDHGLKLVPSLNNPVELNRESAMEPRDQEALGQGASKPAETSPFYSNFVENTTEDIVKQKDQKSLRECMLKPPGSSLSVPFVAKRNFAENLMEQVPVSVRTTQDSYYKSASRSREHPTVGGLSLRQPQPLENHLPSQMIDLENNVRKQEMREADVSFRAYVNQERTDLLPPLLGGPQMLSSYPQQHINGLEQPGLQFLMANDNLSGSTRFSHQFQEQQQLMEQRQAREKELYLQQMMTKNIYSNGRHPIERHFPSLGPQSLAALPPSLNGGIRRHNWYSDEHLASNGWPGLDSSSSVQSLGDGVATDGSLFSVLSECSKLPSRESFDDNRSSEQFVQVRHSVGDGGITGDGNIFGYTPRQPSSSTSHETVVVNPTASSLNNMQWMNFPNQNQRSWNQ
ncbi:uncharacterized protein LOC120249480 [Dioscorea cayenensis subsp. rotundata]|uniref:Uncharacterized protein LOC120249480 n=1 Tax=Dioscorea cayennensis subsp. rotundata TaxID=55577 RepID=A0AB40AGC3_DIOCR|nr:uncharacterized protein LOC120249480 [Dioscorea cayenensis subsp. rotundata]